VFVIRRRPRPLTARLRVQDLEDRCVPTAYLVTNTNDVGTGSLRAAIDDANLHANVGGPDTIGFSITGNGVQTIALASALPDITEAVVIDGYTQGIASPNTLPHNNNAVLLVELDGSAVAGPGLNLNGDGSTVRGLIINRFQGDGITIAGGSNIVEGNFIGTDATGSAATPNTGNGVSLINSAIGNRIGGNTPGEQNRLAFNGGSAIALTGTGAANRLAGNAVFGNGQLDIDLGGDGVTANDPLDADTGPNELQNYPVLATVTGHAERTTITGTLDSTPNTTFVLEFFASPAAGSTGYGPGMTPLGTRTVTTAADGHVDFTIVLPVGIAAGSVVSTTATDTAGNTSEFAQSVALGSELYPTQKTLDAVVLDVAGDGLDLGGIATTSLLNGQPEDSRWTQPNSDDAFVVLDADALAAIGFQVHDYAGQTVTGDRLIQDGLRITVPGQPEARITDGWQMLNLFDANKDGRIDASDPAFARLKLYTDSNGDGAIEPGELQSLGAAVRSILVNANPAVRTDDFNSRRADGQFTRTDGTTGQAVNSWLARPAGDATAPLTYHWTGANSSDWYDPGNWSPAGVPSVVDAAVINSGTVDLGSGVEGVGSLDLYGGVLTGTGTLSVTRLLWAGGTLDGSGTTAIAAGGAWQVRGPAAKALNGHSIASSGVGSVARGFDPILLDLSGNGFALTTPISTNLLTGQPGNFNWVKADPDDTFVLVDATGLRDFGLGDLRNYADQPLNGLVLLTSGLRLRTADGQDHVAADAWQLLAAFDRNGDGRIDSNDPLWDYIHLFTDRDNDGAIGFGEDSTPSTLGVAGLQFDPAATPHGAGAGNVLTDGLFIFGNGSTGPAAQVSLASLDNRATTLNLAGGAVVQTGALGSFQLSTAEPFVIDGPGQFVNAGKLSWTGSAGWNLANGTSLFNDAGGVFLISRAKAVSTAAINDLQLGGSTLVNATGGTIAIDSAEPVSFLGGNIDNAGAVNWTGTGDVRLLATTDFNNLPGGSLTIDRAVPVGLIPLNHLVFGAGSSLNNQAGATVSISSAEDVGIIGGTIDNAGAWNWTGAGDILMSGGALLTNQATGVFNVQTTQPATIQSIGGARIDNVAGGRMNLLTDQAVGIAGGTLNNAGTITWTGSGNLNLTSGAALNNLAGGLLEMHRASPVTPATTDGIGIDLLSNLHNALGGIIEVDSSEPINNIAGAGTFTNDGTLKLLHNALNLDMGSGTGTIILANGSTLNFLGNFSLNNGATITGAGTVRVSSPAGTGTLTTGNISVPNLTIGANGTVKVLGTLTSLGPVSNNGGTLTGSGTIVGNVTNAGTVAPGTTTGRLTVQGTYTQTVAGELDVEIGGNVAGTSYDQLVVTGVATLAGQLNLSLVNAFDPGMNDIFTLVTYPSVVGTFDQVSPIDFPTTRFTILPGPTAFRVIGHDPTPGPSFTDEDGDTYTVKLTGPGTAGVFVLDFDLDGQGPIDQIRLSGTDPKKSKLTITVKKAKSGSDGLVDIGSIVGTGIGGITAKASDLVGAFGHGIELTGALGGLTIHDIKNGTDVTAVASVDSKQKMAIKAHVIEDGTAISVQTPITSFSAARFTNGSIVAPSIGSLKIVGDKKALIDGDFSTDVTLTASVPVSLTSASFAGTVTNSHFTLQGSVGSFTAGGLIDSTIYAAFIPTDVADPMSGGAFAPGFKIGSVTVKGTMANSVVATDLVGKVSIGTVVTDNTANGGKNFGVLAHTKITLVLAKSPAVKVTSKDPALLDGDFEVKVL
jgi:EF hand